MNFPEHIRCGTWGIIRIASRGREGLAVIAVPQAARSCDHVDQSLRGLHCLLRSRIPLGSCGTPSDLLLGTAEITPNI
ncbi:hypothetical protein TorRG33x02_212650 [Trema orientale]|uniref:Uncharacterized protein n=1 Tax=Trema orientale TaxID=63057 RepID=A0A2P5EBQ7_TREOI|nr:hypothetical protein TorRG33x02_212650 [Trema orientale]